MFLQYCFKQCHVQGGNTSHHDRIKQLDMMNCVLQLQIQQQSQVPQPDLDGTGSESEDEIDAALTDLQVTLEGSTVSATGDITRTPELHGYIRFFKYVFIYLLIYSFSMCTCA